MNVLIYLIMMHCVTSTTGVSLPMTRFQKSTNLRYSPSVSTITVRSREDCLSACTSSNICNYANYNQETKSCEFCTTGDVTSATGWNIFLKGPRCISQWSQLGDSCYILVKNKLSWDQSQAGCHALKAGSHLVSIKTQSTFDFLKSTYLQELGTTDRAWIGAQRDGIGDFRWTDLTPMSLDLGWNSSQPDNSGGNENCVHTYPITFRYNDVRCYYQYWSLCEYELNYSGEIVYVFV